MALAVLAGALGAHSLAPYFVAERGAEWWEKASRYHALHALGILGYGLFLRGRASKSWPACCFALGILFFSGSLYAMALGAPRWLGMITPFGGGIWIVAWIGFAVQARLAYPRAPEGTR
jgi:uncharacterized membrane protein YgdD (TMEM256/DUF423 family)